uniref:Uncharacterized protein n=1 Tax=Rhizophora mucronata TaxID=61149 RepID=A0A2P2PBP5_RHIMU
MHMTVYGACSYNHSFSRNNLSVGSNDHIDIIHDVWISSFTNGNNTTTFNTNICLVNSSVVYDHSICYNSIKRGSWFMP